MASPIGESSTTTGVGGTNKRRGTRSKWRSEVATSDDALLRQIQESKTNELIYIILLYIAFCAYLIYYISTR